MSRIWLITGASEGIGRELAKVVAGHGDRVIATSRNPSKAVPIPNVTFKRLDQNEPLPQIQADIKEILAVHGTVDVVVNSAGYVHYGIIEEASPEETLAQFQTNVFGPINVYRAILPHLREKRAGTLVTMGSVAAWWTLRNANLYGASKAALRRLTLSLADEVQPFGIKHCLVEPGYVRRDVPNQGVEGNSPGIGYRSPVPEYAEMRAQLIGMLSAFQGKQPGNPAAVSSIIYDVVTSTGVAEGKELPEVLPLGSDACEIIAKSARLTLQQVEEWAPIGRTADYPPGQ